MKLNFWQWLGVVLLVVGLILYATRTKEGPANNPNPANTPAPTTTPATAPS